MLSRTVGRRDAAAERTGMYLQRVLENITASCYHSDFGTHVSSLVLILLFLVPDSISIH